MDFSILDLIPEPVLVMDRGYRVIYKNRRAVEFYGDGAQSCHQLLHGFERPCHEFEGYSCPMQEMQQVGLTSLAAVHTHTTPQGNRKFYLLSNFDPKRQLFVELHLELEKIEKSLNSEFLRLEKLFSAGPTVVFRWKNAEGWPVLWVSSNVSELLGYPREDFLTGKLTYGELVHPDDMERIIQELEINLKQGLNSWVHKDYRLKTRDGRYIWVLDQTVPVYDDSGKVDEYLGYVTDVTARHEKDEVFRVLAESNPNALVIYSFESNKVIYANQMTSRLLGFSVEELQSMEDPLQLIFWKHRKRAQINVMRRKQGFHEGVSYKLQIHTKDGKTKWVRLDSKVAKLGGLQVSIITLIDISEEIRRERELTLLATRDKLTGIYNRRVLVQELRHAIERARRYGTVFSVILFDLDNFKNVNDTYGHMMGDEALRLISKNIKKVLRKSDIFGRWGGEEFLVILPMTSDCYTPAEKIRKTAEGLSLKNSIRITLSVGATAYSEGDDMDSLLLRADRALYMAKSQGKNTVVVL